MLAKVVFSSAVFVTFSEEVDGYQMIKSVKNSPKKKRDLANPDGKWTHYNDGKAQIAMLQHMLEDSILVGKEEPEKFGRYDAEEHKPFDVNIDNASETEDDPQKTQRFDKWSQLKADEEFADRHEKIQKSFEEMLALHQEQEREQRARSNSAETVQFAQYSEGPLAEKVAPLLWRFRVNVGQLYDAMKTKQLDSQLQTKTKQILSSNSDVGEAVTLLAKWKHEDLIALQNVLNYALKEMTTDAKIEELKERILKLQEKNRMFVSQYGKSQRGTQSQNELETERKTTRYPKWSTLKVKDFKGNQEKIKKLVSTMQFVSTQKMTTEKVEKYKKRIHKLQEQNQMIVASFGKVKGRRGWIESQAPTGTQHN